MTTLALNGLGLTFAAPGEISYNYSKQSWGGYWLGTYFNMNWYGENLTYTAGATLPSSGIITSIGSTSPVTGVPFYWVSGVRYSIESNDIGKNSDDIVYNIMAASLDEVNIVGGSGNDSLFWLGGALGN